MPAEIIGEVGTPGAETKWIAAQGKLAIQHLKQVCGDPPPEMDLEVVWQDLELGSYPVIALVWDDDTRGAPSNYLSRCEAALTAFENGGRPSSSPVVPPPPSDRCTTT